MSTNPPDSVPTNPEDFDDGDPLKPPAGLELSATETLWHVIEIQTTQLQEALAELTENSSARLWRTNVMLYASEAVAQINETVTAVRFGHLGTARAFIELTRTSLEQLNARVFTDDGP